jgi:ceramide glucosyltransferase
VVSDVVWWILTTLAILSLVANATNLVQGIRLRGQVRRALRSSRGGFLPRVAILLPVRGLDDGFDENLRAILTQAYPAYRVVVAYDDPEDPALLRIRAMNAESSSVRIQEFRSDSTDLGGKVNALRSALRALLPEDEVVVFADSDIRPGSEWLRQLVQPLADVSIGASTGFRWYTPPDPNFWSLVRAEWNAVSANVLFDPRRNYTWGGSSAIRVDHLSKLRLEDRWRNVLSDDLVVTRALRDAGLRIEYVPTALVATVESSDRAQCIEWCVRQTTMATLYQPELRRYAVAAFAVFNGSVVLGVLSLVLAATVGLAFIVPAMLFLVTVPTTLVKAALRRHAFLSASPTARRLWQVPGWRAALAALFVPWLMMGAIVKTRKPTSVTWRGRSYDVRDPLHVRLMETRPARGGSPGTSRAR